MLYTHLISTHRITSTQPSVLRENTRESSGGCKQGLKRQGDDTPSRVSPQSEARDALTAVSSVRILSRSRPIPRQQPPTSRCIGFRQPAPHQGANCNSTKMDDFVLAKSSSAKRQCFSRDKNASATKFVFTLQGCVRTSRVDSTFV